MSDIKLINDARLSISKARYMLECKITTHIQDELKAFYEKTGLITEDVDVRIIDVQTIGEYESPQLCEVKIKPRL